MIIEWLSFNWITSQPGWLLWVLIVLSVLILTYGADKLVSGAARLAALLGMSPVIIGATVVSLGTTSPEAAVSVTAALGGKPAVALGNGVGSIICDTALIFGIVLVMKRLPLDRFVLFRQGVMKLVVGFLLAIVIFTIALIAGTIYGLELPRFIGIVFAAMLVGYLYLSVRWSRAHPESIPPEASVAVPVHHRVRMVLFSLIALVGGLILVVGGSQMMIGSVTELAVRWNVPQNILAVTVVAFGTSLPELITAVTAVRKNQSELAIGNVIGADILNVLFVIGLSACASPLEIDPRFLTLHLPVMLVCLTLMGAYIFTSGKTFRRWQGIPLLAVYAGYCTALFLLATGEV